jgi:hypothetical protein
MSRTRVSRYLLVLLIPALLVSARAQVPESPDSLPGVGAIPLAPAQGYHFPRAYPCLDVGFGLRTFSPDLSGLSQVYGATPSFGLSPVLCGVVEIGCSGTLGIQVNAGRSLGGGSNEGYQGLAGPLLYLHPFSNPGLRPCLSAGVAICSFRGSTTEQSIVTVAGATGFYASAGLEYRLARGRAIAIYAGYCSYPRVSSSYTGGGQAIDAAVDFSSAIIGIQLEESMWEHLP